MYIPSSKKNHIINIFIKHVVTIYSNNYVGLLAESSPQEDQNYVHVLKIQQTDIVISLNVHCDIIQSN